MASSYQLTLNIIIEIIADKIKIFHNYKIHTSK